MTCNRINQELTKLLTNFVSFEKDPLDNSLQMDVFNKYQLFSLVKYALKWIGQKIIQENKDSTLSDSTFLSTYDSSVIEALVDCRDSSFQRKGVITKQTWNNYQKGKSKESLEYWTVKLDKH